MATRTKTPSAAKVPAAAKSRDAAPGKSFLKTGAAPGKQDKPVTRSDASARRKTAINAAAAPKKQARPAVTKKATAAGPYKAANPVRTPVAEEQRRNYIEVAAYYIAERRGFFGASALEDWAQAEAEVDRMLREGKLNQ